MWSLAVVKGGTEFLVRDALITEDLRVFLPYTVEKQIATTYAGGRAVHKATWVEVPRWPRYIFAEAKNSVTLLSVKGVLNLVRSAEGKPSQLPNRLMDILRSGCSADGRVIRASELHSFGVGDLLKFVANSSFASRSAEVLSIEDSGHLVVSVDDHLKVRAHYTELTSAIG